MLQMLQNIWNIERYAHFFLYEEPLAMYNVYEIFLQKQKMQFRQWNRESIAMDFRRIFCDRRKRNLHRSLALLYAVLLWATLPIAFLRTTYFFLFFFYKGERVNEQRVEAQCVPRYI